MATKQDLLKYYLPSDWAKVLAEFASHEAFSELTKCLSKEEQDAFAEKLCCGALAVDDNEAPPHTTEAKTEKGHPIPLTMTVDFFKKSGKWAYTSKILTTDEQIRDLKRSSNFGFEAVYDFIREKHMDFIHIDDYYWTVSISCLIPGDEDEMTEFCRFLRRP
jgi:hypothetical protein